MLNGKVLKKFSLEVRTKKDAYRIFFSVIYIVVEILVNAIR